MQWEFKDWIIRDDGSWEEEEGWCKMPEDLSQRLEDAYTVGAGDITVHYGYWLSYDFDFRTMSQRRYHGNHLERERSIRRTLR